MHLEASPAVVFYAFHLLRFVQRARQLDSVSFYRPGKGSMQLISAVLAVYSPRLLNALDTISCALAKVTEQRQPIYYRSAGTPTSESEVELQIGQLAFDHCTVFICLHLFISACDKDVTEHPFVPRSA